MKKPNPTMNARQLSKIHTLFKRYVKITQRECYLWFAANGHGGIMGNYSDDIVTWVDADTGIWNIQELINNA